jgi:hypothetical protein
MAGRDAPDRYFLVGMGNIPLGANRFHERPKSLQEIDRIDDPSVRKRADQVAAEPQNPLEEIHACPPLQRDD